MPGLLERPHRLSLLARRGQNVFSYIFSIVYTIHLGNVCHAREEIASPDGRDIIEKASLANFRPDDISSPMKGILLEQRKHGNTTIFFHLFIIPQSARQAKSEGPLAGLYIGRRSGPISQYQADADGSERLPMYRVNNDCPTDRSYGRRVRLAWLPYRAYSVWGLRDWWHSKDRTPSVVRAGVRTWGRDV